MGLSLWRRRLSGRLNSPPLVGRVGEELVRAQAEALRKATDGRGFPAALLAKAGRPRADPELRRRGPAFGFGRGSESGVGVRLRRRLSATLASGEAKSSGVLSPAKDTSRLSHCRHECTERARGLIHCSPRGRAGPAPEPRLIEEHDYN